MGSRKPFRVLAGGAGPGLRPSGWKASRAELEALAERKREARRAALGLTLRQRQVLSAMARGASDKEIARSLGISPRTVEAHKAVLMERLRANTAADAVRISLYADADLIDDPSRRDGEFG